MKQTSSMIIIVLSLLSLAYAGESALELTPQFTVKESNVHFVHAGQVIKGILTVPENKAKPWPAVAMFHGFTDDKHELPIAGRQEGIFDMAARVFAQQGFASLRIDFRGSGESEGKWEDTTNGGQIVDGLAAVQYLASLPDIDQQHIAVLGFSQGGLVAACIAARDARVKSAILWSPVTYPPLSGMYVFGKEAVEKGLQDINGVHTVTLPWGRQIQLKGTYFQDLFRIDPVAEISHYHGPLLVVVGLKDALVTPQPLAGGIYIAYHQGEESLIALDADHAFNCFVHAAMVDKLIYWSYNWLDKTLK